MTFPLWLLLAVVTVGFALVFYGLISDRPKGDFYLEARHELRQLKVVATAAKQEAEAARRSADNLGRQLSKMFDTPSATPTSQHQSPEQLADLIARRLRSLAASAAPPEGHHGHPRGRQATNRDDRSTTAPSTSLDVILRWWNELRPTAETVTADLERLRAHLPALTVEYVAGVRPLIGLKFDRPVQGNHNLLIMPDMGTRVGALVPVYETPPDCSPHASIGRVISPASIDAKYFPRGRDELASFGLSVGRVEPGAA